MANHAPELLAALENLSEWFGEVNYDSFDSGEIDESQLDWLGLHKVLDRATAAIAKAKEEPSVECPECERDLGPDATSCPTCSGGE